MIAKGSLSVKKLEQIKTSMDTKLKSLMDRPKDDVVTFEELRVNEPIVDEATDYLKTRVKDIDELEKDLINLMILI